VQFVVFLGLRVLDSGGRSDDITLAASFAERKVIRAPLLYAGGFLRYGSFMMCETCGDLFRDLTWFQLQLDERNEVRWTQRECQCEVVLLSVAVGRLVDA
jgi:hypothetical protein